MLFMYNLLNFLNIDSGDYIHEKYIGLNTSNKEQYALLGFHLIDDIEKIENKGKLTFITFISSMEKMNTIINELRNIRKYPVYKNKYIVFKEGRDSDKSSSKSMNILHILRYLLIGIFLRCNPLLFYKYNNERVVINLIPNWPRNITGDSIIYSIISFFYQSIRNLLSITKIDCLVIEFSQ